MKNKKVIERLLFDISRNNDWIRAADQKISIYLAFIGLILTFTFVPLINLLNMSFLKPNKLSFNILIFGILILILGICKLLWVLTSKLKGKRSYRGLIYFGDISSIYFNEYQKQIITQNEKNYIEDLTEQVYTTAVIANDRHTQFNNSVRQTFISFLILLIGYLILIN